MEAQRFVDFIVVSDEVRASYQSNPEYLQELIDDINVRIRRLYQSLAARDVMAQPFSIRLDRTHNEILHV